MGLSKKQRNRGAIELVLRCPHDVNGITADPHPDWSFDDLISELDAIEKKPDVTSDISEPFRKTQPIQSRGPKKISIGTPGFVMYVSDHEIEDFDSDTEVEEEDLSVFPGRKFSVDEPFTSDDSDHDITLEDQSCLIEKVVLAEAEVHELTHELQLSVSNEARNRISSLETELYSENEKFVSLIAKIEKQRKSQNEKEREMDLQHQRTFAEALDNYLTNVRRDHEYISQLEERRIRDDAAREDSKRKEKALREEKIRQEKMKAEEAKIQAEMARAAAEAEKQTAYAENLRESVQKEVGDSTPVGPGFDFKKMNLIRASESALELEKRRRQIYGELFANNEALKANFAQGYPSHVHDFNRLIKTISPSTTNVDDRAKLLVELINSSKFPQSMSILTFAEKVVSNCENSKTQNGFIFACSRVIVHVTSKIPLAMDILISELNRACIYTVPKYIEYSQVAFGSKEAHLKAIGYKEIDGNIEDIDSYVKRLGLYTRLYGALVQTEVEGFQNLLGLKEGWLWLARFLNSLPANLYTAVALHNFLEMCGFALYRRYKNQFEKLLNTVYRFLNALKEDNSDSLKLDIAKTSILHYMESNQYKKEPEGSQPRDLSKFF